MPISSLKLLPIILIGIMIPSFVEVDITLPGFFQMSQYFNSSEAAIQYTLVINFIGLSILTLVYGPLSDIFGRKKILIFGCSLFFLGSIGCLLSSQLYMLYASRFLQGLGCSAVWVTGFIVCSDSYKNNESIRVFGLLNAAISTSLVLAPILGAFIVDIYRWRAAFFAVALLSVFSLILTISLLPETNNAKKTFSLKTAFSDYYQLGFNYRFLAYALAPSILLAAFIAYISSIPFLYIDQLKVGYKTFAFLQAIPGAALALFGLYSGKINQKIGSSNCITLSVIICAIGCIVFLITSRTVPSSPIYFTLSMALICIGSSLQFSLIFAKSLELYPKLSGSASSLITFIRLIIFSISVSTASKYYSGQLYDTAQIIVIITVIGLVLSLYVKYDLISGASSQLQREVLSE